MVHGAPCKSGGQAPLSCTSCTLLLANERKMPLFPDIERVTETDDPAIGYSYAIAGLNRVWGRH